MYLYVSVLNNLRKTHWCCRTSESQCIAVSLQSRDPWSKRGDGKNQDFVKVKTLETCTFAISRKLKYKYKYKYKPAHLQSQQSVTAREEALESSQLQLGRRRAAQAQVPQVPANTKYRYKSNTI